MDASHGPHPTIEPCIARIVIVNVHIFHVQASSFYSKDASLGPHPYRTTFHRYTVDIPKLHTCIPAYSLALASVTSTLGSLLYFPGIVFHMSSVPILSSSKYLDTKLSPYCHEWKISFTWVLHLQGPCPINILHDF